MRHLSTLLVGFIVTLASVVQAQPGWPEPGRPIKVIVGFAAGGGADARVRRRSDAHDGAAVAVEPREGHPVRGARDLEVHRGVGVRRASDGAHRGDGGHGFAHGASLLPRDAADVEREVRRPPLTDATGARSMGPCCDAPSP